MKKIKMSIISLIILSLFLISCSPNKNNDASNKPSPTPTTKSSTENNKSTTPETQPEKDDKAKEASSKETNTSNKDNNSNPKGSTLITDTKNASKTLDSNQVKVSNGEQVKFDNYRVLGWLNDDSIVLLHFNSNKVSLYDTKTKKINTLKFDIPGEISSAGCANGKILSSVHEVGTDPLNPRTSYYEYDVNTGKPTLILQNNKYGRAEYIDDNQKYILIQCYDLKVGDGNGFDSTNHVSIIIDRASGKSISINEEELCKDLNRYPYGKEGMAIAYSNINNKFYGALKNKIYTFTFDNPTPKAIKDTGNLDVGCVNFNLLNNDTGLLFETTKESSDKTETYMYNFSSNQLTKIVESSPESSNIMSFNAYSYNKTKNKIFTQTIDNKTSVIYPIIGELSKDKLIVKSKISTTEEIKNEVNNSYTAIWNKSGTKLLLTCYYVKQNKNSVQTNQIQRIINIQ